MQLYFRDYGEPAAPFVPLLLLHGLLGSGGNWHGIARALAGGRRVIVPDLRNHGRSPHADDVSYPALAGDVQELLVQLGLERVAVIGHSMGGKLAMWLALTRPALVERLVVADIAPVRYPNRFDGLLGVLGALPLNRLADRRAVDHRLAAAVPDAAVRGYLLQNLVRGGDGTWQWRVNLPALTAGLQQISDFPVPPPDTQFPGPALFLYGGQSDYVLPAHEPQIRAYFPFARLRALAGAGHWLYANQPEAFVRAVDAFLA